MDLPFNPYLLLFNLQEKFLSSPYLKLIIVFGLLFFFVVLLGLVRKHIFQISLKGAVFGFVLGIILMILLDLIILFGISDKEKLKRLISGENRPEMAAEVITSGVSNLTRVLGVSTTVVNKNQKPKNVEEVISDYLSLPQSDAQKFKNLLCPL